MKKQMPNSARLLARLSVAAAALALATTSVATPSVAQTAKACEDLGGTSRFRDLCDLATKPAPFDIVYTRRSQTPERGPLFKITNKYGRPVKVRGFLAFAYDKAGKQLAFSLGDGKGTFMTSGPFELELAPGESKEYPLFGFTKALPPEIDTLQGEVNEWSTPDSSVGTLRFRREFSLAQMAARPNGGWK